MREFKFRLWDLKNKIWITPSHLEVMGADGTLEPIGTPESVENYVIQQYTGIKDINGEEIYEGDIVEFTNEYGKIKCGKIIWGEYNDDEYVEHLQCWMVISNRIDDPVYNLPLSCAVLSGGVDYGRGDSVISNTFKVIGNIFGIKSRQIRNVGYSTT
jgi:uncharacterized phage protein (TIGR01671 family)